MESGVLEGSESAREGQGELPGRAQSDSGGLMYTYDTDFGYMILVEDLVKWAKDLLRSEMNEKELREELESIVSSFDC